MALVTRIPGLYTASGVLPHALFLSLSLRGGEEGSKSKARLHGALAESELREEFKTAFLLVDTDRAKGVEALFTRLGEEAVIGAVFASFHSPPDREILC